MPSRRQFLLASLAGAVSSAAGTEERPLELAGGANGISVYWGEKWDKPFLYPIRTVSGKTLSRGWPIEPREGDSKDHVWHRGFWYGHGIINGADFWREQGREKTARLITTSKPRVRRGGVTLELAMTPPSGKPIGSMSQQYRVTDHGGVRIIDAVITMHTDAGTALTFGDSDDGGFAFRLCEAFREDRGATLRNSDGLQGTKSIWGKPATWVDYAAEVEGKRAGVAMLDHPSNLRHPTRWHARGYGLNAANPFALKSFTKDPAADGSYTLPAGEKLVLRYRTLIYEGSPDIGRFYTEYSKT
jgi:hypothetical protein